MGYQTRFQITALGPAERESAFFLHLRDVADISDSIATVEDFNGWDTMKWYDCHENIARTMRLSDVLELDLNGEGEEQGDVWDAEYRMADGKVTCTLYKYALIRPTVATAVLKL